MAAPRPPVDVQATVKRYRANQTAMRQLVSINGVAMALREDRAQRMLTELVLAHHADLAHALDVEGKVSWILARQEGMSSAQRRSLIEQRRACRRDIIRLLSEAP